MKFTFAIFLSALVVMALASRVNAGGEEKVKLVITGGHETDPRDHGRPVILIGNALGVTPEVFREAFSHVKPAPASREPEPERVQQNKTALLNALTRYEVTNDRLDRVSNYYRYRPESGRLWPTAPALAFATMTNGVVTSIVITEAGSGYSSPPKISIPGHPEIALKATLAFSRDFGKNGSLASITAEGDTTREKRER